RAHLLPEGVIAVRAADHDDAVRQARLHPQPTLRLGTHAAGLLLRLRVAGSDRLADWTLVVDQQRGCRLGRKGRGEKSHQESACQSLTSENSASQYAMQPHSYFVRVQNSTPLANLSRHAFDRPLVRDHQVRADFLDVNVTQLLRWHDL